MGRAGTQCIVPPIRNHANHRWDLQDECLLVQGRDQGKVPVQELEVLVPKREYSAAREVFCSWKHLRCTSPLVLEHHTWMVEEPWIRLRFSPYHRIAASCTRTLQHHPYPLAFGSDFNMRERVAFLALPHTVACLRVSWTSPHIPFSHS